MPFVHGHPRDAGWVVSHFRRPQRAGAEQLDLDDTDDTDGATTDLGADAGAGSVPAPRSAPETETESETDEDGRLSGAGDPP